MDLEILIAQWSGRLPPGFVPHAVIRQEPPQCVLCGATHNTHRGGPFRRTACGTKPSGSLALHWAMRS